MKKCMIVMIVFVVSMDLISVVSIFLRMNGVLMKWFEVFIRCMILSLCWCEKVLSWIVVEISSMVVMSMSEVILIVV